MLRRFENFKVFLNTRPPAVLFLFCIIILTIFTFSMALYTERNEDILNTDILRNWNNLRRYFNDLDYCVTKNDKVMFNEKENTSVKAFVTIGDLKMLENFTNVHGYLGLEDFQANCPNSIVPSYLKIAFSVPEINASEENNKVCAEIFGPPDFLPTFSMSPCVPTFKDEGSIGILTSKKHKFNQEFCQNDLGIKLQFDNNENNENFIIKLSQEDVSKIYMHLLYLSFSLLFIIICILLYAVFHKHNQPRTSIAYNYMSNQNLLKI